MNKTVTIIIILFAAVWFGMRLFNYYDATHILSSQAAFKIYLDVKENDIDSFFAVEKGTYDKEKHVIICRPPVNVTGFMPQAAPARFNMQNIDCSREYDPQIDNKYDGSELEGNYFTLYIIKKGMPLALFNPRMTTGGDVIAYKTVSLNFERGRINHIGISAYKEYDACTKQSVNTRDSGQ